MKKIKVKNEREEQDSLYFNHEISTLQYNGRLLELAENGSLPLLERWRYACIFCKNIDEYVEVRLLKLKALADGENHSDFIPVNELKTYIKKLFDKHATIFNQLTQELKQEKIIYRDPLKLTKEMYHWQKKYFRNNILPLLTPIRLDPAHPMPLLVNEGVNMVVTLKDKQGLKPEKEFLGIIPIPRNLPPLILIPPNLSHIDYFFVSITSMIRTFVYALFPGMTADGCYSFRLNRNAEFNLESTEEDLAHSLQKKRIHLHLGIPVMLQLQSQCPQHVGKLLAKNLNLKDEDVYIFSQPVNVSQYNYLYQVVDRPNLKYPPIHPTILRESRFFTNIFEAIQHGDILLHHPYQSFDMIVEFMRQASKDPQVLSIKQTLYRVGPNSPIVNALIDAAHAGKQVVAVIELRARFDQEHNLELANRLQAAGALVIYGTLNYKTHCKMMLVIRKEGASDTPQLKFYSHLSTGNYNISTAGIYRDYSIFTCNQQICHDVQHIFHQITTGGSTTIELRQVFASPFNMIDQILYHIEYEAEQVGKGLPARIVAKITTLTDKRVINALYSASQAGVKIDLIVRSACCLRPGVEELSENIRVFSFLGPFLEHERILYFHHSGEKRVYCTSADWRERNLYKRIDICFPIQDKDLKVRILKESIFDYFSADTVSCWELKPDGQYEPTSRKVFLSRFDDLGFK